MGKGIFFLPIVALTAWIDRFKTQVHLNKGDEVELSKIPVFFS